ncbi:WD40 repeat domain-containing protein [Kitasatospora sp. NPDC094028]
MATTLLDGRPVVVSCDDKGGVRLWDLTTCRPVGDPLDGHPAGVLAVAAAVVDGRPLAVTGGLDRTARVWDLTTGKQLGEPLTGHARELTAVALTKVDGRPCIATGSWDRTVRVWDLATGRPVGRPVLFPTPILKLAADPTVAWSWASGTRSQCCPTATARLSARRTAVPGCCESAGQSHSLMAAPSTVVS